MKLKDAIAQRINDLCEEHKLTPHGLSLQSGVASSTVADMVKAHNDSPQLKHIYAICASLDMSLEQFFNSPLFDKDTLTD